MVVSLCYLIYDSNQINAMKTDDFELRGEKVTIIFDTHYLSKRQVYILIRNILV